MSYTARTRDRHRLAVSAVTGVITAASLTSVGWLTGAAADDFEQDQAEQQAQLRRERAEYDAAVARAQRHDVLRQRPARTRVTTRYVRAAAASAGVGAGGTVSASSPAPSTGASGPGPSGASSSAGGSAAQPPPPPSSSGS
jgi:hypothetical protein